MTLRHSPVSFEQLEDRLTPATTAFFAFGVLTVVGDGGANNITVLSVAGNLEVTDNGQNVPIRSLGGTPTLARTALVSIAGLGGDDKLDGGGADGSIDVLIGGPGSDVFVRTAGQNDVFLDLDPDEDTILDV